MRKLSELFLFFSPLLSQLAQRVSFDSRPELGAILKENPHLVLAVSHGSPLSWIPAVSLLTVEAVRAEGGSRKPVGVVDRFFFEARVLRPLGRFLTQSDQSPGFESLLEKFRSDEASDLVIFPEGANSFFGDLSRIQPFRSPRFVELAVRAGVPILIVVHEGSEAWSKTLKLPDLLLQTVRLFPRFARPRWFRDGKLNLPAALTRMEHFQMRCELYRPALKASELSENQAERRRQIGREAEKIRARMQELLEELRIRSGRLVAADSG